MSVKCQTQTLRGAAINRDLLGHVLSNFRQQMARAVRFRHIVITSRRPRRLFFPIQRMGGDSNDWNRSQDRIGLDLARDLVAVHDRQLDTDQYEIRSLFRHSRQCLLAVLGLLIS